MIRTNTWLHCDHLDCKRKFKGDRSFLRQAARRKGWRRYLDGANHTMDLCPEHASKGAGRIEVR